ncbi:MAG: hypothetical protein QOF48_3112 [Verrucomicrobiota bacterium]
MSIKEKEDWLDFGLLEPGGVADGWVLKSMNRLSRSKGKRSRRFSWRRQRWWIALGLYSICLVSVLGMFAQRRWNPNTVPADPVVTRPNNVSFLPWTPAGLPVDDVSARWSTESVVKGWAVRSAPAYLTVRGGRERTDANAVSKRTLLPERQPQFPWHVGPGLEDVKLFAVEPPDLKGVTGH